MGGAGGGGGAELFTRPYPLKVQSRPPHDQRLATQSRVSGGKDYSDSEKGNPLPPHRLLLSSNSKGSFICTIPQTG